MTEFVVKDSGERQQFDSGMVRDTTEGKADFSLVYDGPMLKRWAVHLTKGAEKYAPRNWMLARGLSEYLRFKASAARHFFQWMIGDRDEDHASAVFFNINGAEYVKEQMDAGAHSSDAPDTCMCETAEFERRVQRERDRLDAEERAADSPLTIPAQPCACFDPAAATCEGCPLE